MDITELLLNQAAPGGHAGKSAEAGRFRGGADIDLADERCKKVARDFESVFIHEILKSMEETIPDSDTADQSSKQVKSMYWSHMAQAIADKGGLGFWKDIYEAMGPASQETAGQQHNQAVRQILDKSV